VKVAGIALLGAVAGLAQAADAARESSTSERLDGWHDWLYLKVQDWAQGLDHHFVREGQPAEPTPSSPFRISFDAEAVNHPGGLAYRARPEVDLLLQLPNLEKRLKIFITSDDVQESPNLVDDSDRRVRAGGRLALTDYLNFDLGIRLDLPPAAFGAIRFQRQYGLAGWDIEPFAKVYYDTKDHFGAASGITFDRWMNRFLVRSSTYGNWRNDQDATRWTQTLMFAHAREILRFGRYGSIVRGTDLVRAIGIQALASGKTTDHVDTYELSVFAKMPTGRNWLYWHVTPLVRWERQYGWSADPGIRAGVDILFWDRSDR
jgi:hypothetical protein